MNRAIALLALPGLALSLAACGDQNKDVEKSVTKILGERGYPGAKVDCPSSVDVKKGTTFDCTVTGNDKISAVTIKINDSDGKDLTLESAEK
jgi:hypothetical protein